MQSGFLPLIRLPISGSVSYFFNDRGDGVIILVIAGIGAAGAYYARRWIVACCGVLATLQFAAFCFRFVLLHGEVSRTLTKQLAGNLFSDWATLAINVTQLGWGAAVLAAGAIGMLASTLFKGWPESKLTILGVLKWIQAHLVSINSWVPIGLGAAATIGIFLYRMIPPQSGDLGFETTAKRSESIEVRCVPSSNEVLIRRCKEYLKNPSTVFSSIERLIAVNPDAAWREAYEYRRAVDDKRLVELQEMARK